MRLMERMRLFGVMCWMWALVGAAASAEDENALSALGPPDRPYADYLDKRLPQDVSEIPLTPFEGERYGIEAPDTLDLAEMGRETINYLTRLVAPEDWDYWVYHLLHLSHHPAILSRIQRLRLQSGPG